MLSIRTQFVAVLLLVLPLPACSQSGDTTASGAHPAIDSQMALPPPVSGEAYPSNVGSETRSNYLGVGTTLSSGYIHNLYPESGHTPVDDSTYLIQPRISLDQVTSRTHEFLRYSPAFTYYQPNSALNTTMQDAAAELQLQLSPHVSLLTADVFEKASTAFAQSGSSPEGTVYGSAPAVTPGIVAPFAPQWSNNSNAALSWQFAYDSMVGASGAFTELNLTNSPQADGFYDSTSRGGSGFYAHRMTERQYVGTVYQYSWIHATPSRSIDGSIESAVQTHEILGYYTFYLTPNLSVSLAGGSEAYELKETLLPSAHSWVPTGTASLGWQGLHTSIAGSYSRIVTSGEGVAGAFQSDSASASGRWRMTRVWTAGIGGGYSDIKNVAPSSYFASTPGGDAISGSATIQYKIGSNLGLSLNYERLHQTYADIPAVINNPDSDQILFSLEYRLSRPLGR